MTHTQTITVAHSPDPDDAFMFYALAHDKLDTGGLRFSHVLEDIESLNRKGLVGHYDLTAISFHAFAYIADRYVLLTSGASMGDRYGPIVVAKRSLTVDELKSAVIGVPGTMTTAFLGLRLLQPSFNYKVIPFDQILDEVAAGSVDAGLIIHEGQLTYESLGLRKVVDLGEWWHEQTQLPLPLGGNAIRRDLGHDTIRRVSSLLKQSIHYAFDHREEALAYALGFGRGLNHDSADTFVGMYVNDLTLDYGDAGRRAVELLLKMGYEKGVIPRLVAPEFF
jgi:1,4-dihydroxy-6-naphthoate synthase